MIQNPTPITAGTFNGMWISNIRLQMPDLVFSDPVFPQSKGRFTAILLPYDGSHLLATGGTRVNITDLKGKRALDTTFNNVITSILSEVKRQAKISLDPMTINVIANDPTKPVYAIIEFSDKTTYNIKDCYALCAKDNTFAGVLISVMNEVARQAELSNV